jgi:hypothetical protein
VPLGLLIRSTGNSHATCSCSYLASIPGAHHAFDFQGTCDSLLAVSSSWTCLHHLDVYFLSGTIIVCNGNIPCISIYVVSNTHPCNLSPNSLSLIPFYLLLFVTHNRRRGFRYGVGLAYMHTICEHLQRAALVDDTYGHISTWRLIWTVGTLLILCMCQSDCCPVCTSSSMCMLACVPAALTVSTALAVPRLH